MEENPIDDENIQCDELLRELKALAKTLVVQYNECVQGTRKLLKKLKQAESSNEEILLVPKPRMKRWLDSTGFSEQEAFPVEDFLRHFFSNAAKQGRLEYSTLTLQLTKEEQALFEIHEPTVSYFQFMTHLPIVFA